MDNSVVKLSDENGNEEEYEIVDYIDVDEKMYVVLYKADHSDTEVLITRVQDIEDQDRSEFIVEKDENILKYVFEKFKENNIGRINFTDSV